MPDIIDMINFSVVIAGITVSILGLVLVFRAQYMDKQVKRLLLCIFAILIAYTLSDLTSQISLVFLGRDFRILSKAAVFFESFFSSLLMPLLTVLLLTLCGEGFRGKLFYGVSVLWTAYATLLAITQFTTIIYYIDSDNVYHRGPYYPMLLAPSVLLMICNMIGLYRRRSVLTPKERRAFRLYLIIPLISMFIQMFSYGILLIVLGSSVSAFTMFLFLLDDQSDKAVAQAIEIGEQQLRIRTLQMRPHFIYNTMSNIYYLCELDPMKAQRVVGDFTTYLRNNFSAVVKQGLIPFKDELEHTKAFLAVVKARYENQLYVEYDTPVTTFRVPPLTLEPIVENAVKHGIDPELSPLYIWIHTRPSNKGTEIIVENTGVELTLKENEYINKNVDGEPHIGLQNVSDRLKALCNGSLTICPRSGGGTIVTLLIPIE